MKTKLRELSRETLQNIILDLSESLIEAQSQKLQALIERSAAVDKEAGSVPVPAGTANIK